MSFTALMVGNYVLCQSWGFISQPLTACALLHRSLYPTSIRELQYSVHVTMLHEHSVTCPSGDLLTGAKARDLTNMWICSWGRGVLAVVSTPLPIISNLWCDQSSYSTCLLLHCEQPQWSGILLLWFFPLWVKCNLHSVLKVTWEKWMHFLCCIASFVSVSPWHLI